MNAPYIHLFYTILHINLYSVNIFGKFEHILLSFAIIATQKQKYGANNEICRCVLHIYTVTTENTSSSVKSVVYFSNHITELFVKSQNVQPNRVTDHINKKPLLNTSTF